MSASVAGAFNAPIVVRGLFFLFTRPPLARAFPPFPGSWGCLHQVWTRRFRALQLKQNGDSGTRTFNTSVRRNCCQICLRVICRRLLGTGRKESVCGGGSRSPQLCAPLTVWNIPHRGLASPAGQLSLCSAKSYFWQTGLCLINW